MILITSEKNNFYSLTDEGNLQKLSDFQNKVKWFDAINKMSKLLETAHKNKEIIFLYRGENKTTFLGKTGTKCDYSDHPFYDRFFIIGSKAKSYLENNDNKIIPIKQFDSDSKTKYIFKGLNRLSKNMFKNNDLSYFQNENNLDEFRKNIYNISDNDHRLTIENIFLAFIHTLSSDPNEIDAYSALISSTRNVKVSKNFAQKGYIIAFWLSKPIHNQAIDYCNIDNYNNLLARYNLPTINSVHFPDESEVTVFSAIFPHNIFYVYDISNNIQIFNPYIIETNLDCIIKNGINVDQSNFNDKLKGIYSRSIWRNDSRLLYEK